jgi:hypothetical protein
MISTSKREEKDNKEKNAFRNELVVQIHEEERNEGRTRSKVNSRTTIVTHTSNRNARTKRKEKKRKGRKEMK